MTHVSDGLRVGANFDTNGNAVDPGGPLSPIYAYNVVPIALVTDGIALAQAVAAAGDLTLNGSLASGGAVTLDVPRNVIIDSSGADTTQTATVYGYDVYGIPMSEAIAFNGTTAVAGKKAFKRVTRIAIDILMAGNAFVGTGDVLGLPYFTSSRNYVLTAYDGAFVTTGTYVAGVTTTATTTTGDVRGTYTPPSATDAAKRLTAYIFLADPDSKAGLYGVPQA